MPDTTDDVILHLIEQTILNPERRNAFIEDPDRAAAELGFTLKEHQSAGLKEMDAHLDLAARKYQERELGLSARAVAKVLLKGKPSDVKPNGGKHDLPDLLIGHFEIAKSLLQR